MMIWLKPGTLASRRTIDTEMNPRAIYPLNEGYSE
jgi:hypothetical protein